LKDQSIKAILIGHQQWFFGETVFAHVWDAAQCVEKPSMWLGRLNNDGVLKNI
jgi:hypothetical protein